MRIIKSFSFVLILLCLCSCNKKDDIYPSPDFPIVEIPDHTISETADGYRDIPANTDTKETLYYANKVSKKIHLPSCYYAKKMAETNTRIENNKDLLLSEGYTNCNVCKP